MMKTIPKLINKKEKMDFWASLKLCKELWLYFQEEMILETKNLLPSSSKLIPSKQRSKHWEERFHRYRLK